MHGTVSRSSCQVKFARTSSFFSPGVAASSHMAVARDAMIIAVRSFDFVDLLAETTIAPVVDTSAAAVSRVGSSAVLSRSQRWGTLTDMRTPGMVKMSPRLFVVALAPALSPREARSTEAWGQLAPSTTTRLHLTSSATATYRCLQRLQRL